MKYISFLCILFISFSSLAQEHSFGFEVGINRTNLNSNLPGFSRFKTGYSGGFNYEYTVGKKMTISSDLLFVRKG